MWSANSRRPIHSPKIVKDTREYTLQECIEKGKKPFFDAMPMIYEDSKQQLEPVKPVTYGIS
jgi:hypothetical protein